MASLSDILNTIQQGVVAVNNLVTQTSGSFLNIQGQLTALSCSVAASSGVKSFNARVGVVVPVQGDYPTSLIPGTTTNNNATAGNIGEVVSITASSSQSVIIDTNTNTTILSVSLSAGDWDARGTFGSIPVNVSGFVVAALSTVNNGLPSGFFDGIVILQPGTAFPSGARQTVMVGPTRFSFASSGTVYLVGQMGSSAACYGSLVARRVR